MGGLDAERDRRDFHEAALEIEKEQHEFLGFMDVVKGLFMWIETPEERVTKNRSVRVDEASIVTLAN